MSEPYKPRILPSFDVQCRGGDYFRCSDGSWRRVDLPLGEKPAGSAVPLALSDAPGPDVEVAER